ncbi:hypothetical protein [Pseudomonas sp. PS01299]|uniref:hypothetical protein n=1 Tax=Pseudomonas sp. PS01299 TaxID=2991435 RepID=UPI002499C948|nr:hypothetical protein [Pseudomonas sp. PS01299]
MRKKSFGLEWLDKHDLQQQLWAHRYLQGKGWIDPNFTSSMHKDLLRVGEKLARSRDDQAIIEKMKNAWRQKRYRAPHNGRKACTYKLKTEVKRELSTLARQNRTNETSMLSTMIYDESQAHAKLKEQLKQLKDQLSASKEEINKHKQANKTLMDLLKSSVAALSRFKILLQDVAPSIEPVTQDQQRRIDKLCRQIMVDAEAIVKGQSTQLPGELFNHAIPVGDATHALKEAATASPFCSQKSSTDNQSSSTEDTFKIDSERLPLPEDPSEPSLVLAAAPHDPSMNHFAGLDQDELPGEKNPAPLAQDAPNLESRSVPQSRPGSEALTDISTGLKKIPLQIKKTTALRVSQGKPEEN